MTILVTGSEGNIGPYIVSYINTLYPEAQVVRVSRHPYASEKGEICYTGDLTDREFVNQLFATHSIDVVIHAAGTPYQAALYQDKPFFVFQNDLSCLLNVLSAAGSLQKFIYLSSATVYESAKTLPLVEDEELLRPQSPYGFAKFTAERVVAVWSKERNIPYTIWRLFNVVSPREATGILGGHVFADFYTQLFIQHAERVRIMGSGKQVRCFTWVEDVAYAIVSAMFNRESNNQILNLAGSEMITLVALVQLLLKIGKDKGILQDSYAPLIETGEDFFGMDNERRIPSVEKTRQLLGITCSTSITNCFERFISEKNSL